MTSRTRVPINQEAIVLPQQKIMPVPTHDKELSVVFGFSLDHRVREEMRELP
jgi:hypothetical protein